MADRPPESEDDWIVHSINIHGGFFERWCERTIRSEPGWEVARVREPVEFPPSDGLMRGKESALDVHARFPFMGRTRFIHLLIECKKNNPDFVKWIFFPKVYAGWDERDARKPARESTVARTIQFNPADPRYKPIFQIRPLSFLTDASLADEAREVRGSYVDHRDKKTRTRTANDSVSDAFRQVALATQATYYYAQSEMRHLITTTSPEKIPQFQLFLPVVVTTARLFMCLFDPGDVHPDTGEIAFEKTALEEVKHLRVEYPLPKHLQSLPTTNGPEPMSDLARMDLVVVHSMHLVELLQYFAGHAEQIF